MSAVRIAAGIACLMFAAAAILPAVNKGQEPPTMAACTAKDGSTPGQEFPCRWDAAAQGNGQGQSFILTSHLCSHDELAEAQRAYMSGHARPLSCQRAPITGQ